MKFSEILLVLKVANGGEIQVPGLDLVVVALHYTSLTYNKNIQFQKQYYLDQIIPSLMQLPYRY